MGIICTVFAINVPSQIVSRSVQGRGVDHPGRERVDPGQEDAAMETVGAPRRGAAKEPVEVAHVNS